MRQLPSNVIAGPDYFPNIVAETLFWIRPHAADLQAVCGRCLHVCQTYNLKVKWSDREPSHTTTGLDGDQSTLPREDLRFLFDNITLAREYIPPFVPKVVRDDIIAQGPALRYLRCHWQSKFIGSKTYAYPGDTGFLVTVPNTQWFLWYGRSTSPTTQDNIDFKASQPLTGDPVITDASVSANAIKEALSSDSSVSSTGPDFGDYPRHSGWVLSLMRRLVGPYPTAQSSEKVYWQSYGTYQLDTSVFDGASNQVFKPIHNPLQLPTHEIVLSPNFY